MSSQVTFGCLSMISDSMISTIYKCQGEVAYARVQGLVPFVLQLPSRLLRPARLLVLLVHLYLRYLFKYWRKE